MKVIQIGANNGKDETFSFIKKNNDKIELACHYLKSYAFNIKESNPRIKDYDEILNWCNINEVPLYLNLLVTDSRAITLLL